MYLFTTIDIPANTFETTPVHVIIPLSKGILESVLIDFPKGCVRLAKIFLTLHAKRFIPFNLATPVAYDDKLLIIPMNFPIENAPYELEAYCWNEDDTYPHEITVGINMGYAKLPDQNPLIQLTTPIEGNMIEGT